MKTWVLAVTILVALLFGFHSWKGNPRPVDAQEIVKLEGQVVNRTEGATLEPGLPVMLHSFGPGSGGQDSGSPSPSVFLTQDTITDESGNFVFSNVELLQDGGYAVTMDYAGTRYSSLLSREDLEEPVELVVYETTQDISIIRVVHQALILTEVDPREQMITAAIFVSLSNESDRTLLPDLTNVTPGRFSFLRFSLPPQAEELDVQSDLLGGQIIPTGSGFALTAPVSPGEHNISFSFRFPYQENVLSYRQSLLQGADVFQVLIPQRLSEIQVGTLEPVTSLNSANASYLVWESVELIPGQGVEVELANLPRSNPLSRWGRAAVDPDLLQIALPVALGAALAGLLIYGGILGTRRVVGANAVTSPEEFSQVPSASQRNRAQLIGDIAALDHGFQQGEIDSDIYNSRRIELKALALNVVADLSSPAENEEIEAKITSPEPSTVPKNE